ncbi:hypothetical protein GUJ93_ZPchr0013g37074 [Zizania palustris]|uniref:Uncharacterized protein n=1 Tax=Zizania palustris TaxID=103762 RepID=A0A8J6C2J7_ZIZPA|nr:hypothetical protein GUJ93_ZPchr0013g37074 [Zizania palustris]
MANQWRVDVASNKRWLVRDESWGNVNRVDRNQSEGSERQGWQRGDGGLAQNEGWKSDRMQKSKANTPGFASVEFKRSDPPKPDDIKVTSVRRNLPNQSGLVANQKELKSSDNPPPSSSLPLNDTGGEHKDKGKKQLDDLQEDDEFSDDSGKVDIPDFIDDHSGDDCGDLLESVHKAFAPNKSEYDVGCSNLFGGDCGMVSKQLEQAEFGAMDPPLTEPSMVIVPYRANEFVEMLVASEYQDSLPAVNCAELLTQQECVLKDDPTAVSKKAKKGKKMRGPPIAQRKSARIKRDGVPISVKAQQRKDKQDDLLTGVHKVGGLEQAGSNADLNAPSSKAIIGS